MKKEYFDKTILDGLTLYYLSPLRGTDGYTKVAMMVKAGMQDSLAKAPMTLVTFDNMYSKMVRDLGYPLPPEHESYRDDKFRDNLVKQFHEIVVAVGLAEMMRMAGYRQEDISYYTKDSDGKRFSYQSKHYKRLHNRFRLARLAAKSAKEAACPDKAGSTVKPLGERKNGNVHGDVSKKQVSFAKESSSSSDIMNLEGISKVLTEVSTPNRTEVLKSVLSTMSASEKENLKRFI